ncbi:MAG: DUF1566 domain-containing protein [Desulfobacula sp.]|uniref:Lcl C-terminal domain-containing protein n=1 Tax=Desulfobacula sp. TaxID=2593537 RepID=UPI0025C07C75|nr:DUF1566 domain-containing protein [Desulfobacula sp.]MCD4718777.1 DUF1566 domain-containing protein [Desulfobacula sp.]
MKKRFRLFLVFSVVLMIPFLCQAFDQWPDTGQTTSYTDTFGEDSDYSINPQSYTKLGSGGVELSDTATVADGWIMTRDNVTGLIWEIKTNDSSIHDRDDTYTWYNTVNFIAAVNNGNFGGFSGWRMPTVKELSTIVNSEIYNPAINKVFFPYTVSSDYWSSTTYANNSGHAWLVYFGRGGVGSHYPKSSSYYVRAVRGGQ